ncbi:MAG: 4Fe-4S binding protein, partial [Treponema sp.]|nr:4Fe-4S binding protein [Treponema sp.]
TEQDTRNYAQYSKLPCFDPSTPLEAYQMVQEAFELSEKYNTPVLLRPTTRVDHAYESMDFPELGPCRTPGAFEKDSARWVIFPKASFNNHKRIFDRNEKVLPDEFSNSKWNCLVVNDNVVVPEALEGPQKIAFAAGGISYCYLMEALSLLGMTNYPVLKIGTPYPFPKQLAEKFLRNHGKVIVFEELDPVIEENLIRVAGSANINVKISGKLDGTVPVAGELSVEIVKEILKQVQDDDGIQDDATCHAELVSASPSLPIRPPVLCAGCPHRGAFYAVKQAMKGKKTVYCGDIGCYTLGNAQPLDMTDTCLCMGADITMAQGFYHNEPDRYCFSFIGDSTFFASGITGVVNGVYNQAKQTICILDNSTTAMTGHQPHPGTGMTMMGQVVDKISIEKILQAIGVSPVITVNPFDQKAAVDAVKTASEAPGVSAIIFKAPCIAIAQKVGWEKPHALTVDTAKCIGCRKCINELGCPALSVAGKKVEIDKSLCTGCGLCSQVCPTGAIL